MARGNVKLPEEEGGGGAPKWMVTFSDCMTLLLTFFVLLLTFSSFDDKEFRRMMTSLAQSMPSVGMKDTRDRNAINAPEAVRYEQERKRGSEKRTKESKVEGNIAETSDVLNIDSKRVFLIPSSEFFWGQGPSLSTKGRDLLKDLAALFAPLPNHIVISENKPISREDNQIGLLRACTVMNTLIKKYHLDASRFAIATQSTIPLQRLPAGFKGTNRLLEIVVLDRTVSQ